MHIRTVLRIVGFLIFFSGAFMALPLGVSLIYGDGSSRSLLGSMILSCGVGALLFLSNRRRMETYLSHREGIAVVTFGWVGLTLVGAVPFLFSGTIPEFTNAYFESMSGFTTTGASILTDVEQIPAGILLWRSLTHWLGGMGIIVLSIAVLPFLGVGGMQLYKGEVPGPVVDKLKPRISDTAGVLWKVYIFITALEVALLWLGNMPLFDAVCHSFATMSTGGFSTKNASLAHYQSAYLEWIVFLFMLLGAMNFSLHYRFIKGSGSVYYRDPECRAFLIIVGALILAITFDIQGRYSLLDSFRHAAFQVSSIVSTTGFATADFDRWPSLSKGILLLCMLLGGMAGSTAGGIKTMRIILMAKHAYQQIFRIVHPHAVLSVKLGGKPVPQEILTSIWGFFFIYLGFLVLSTLIMAALGLDLVSAFSSVAACICNVGPGLGVVGPMTNYAAIPLPGKWILILCMLLGRLEIYTVIVLMVPAYWRK